ncbi:hypothetical protein BJ322DRAFT_188059 [Thelephora terrestris]|uniref:F-box domain-containing protein n=1 Tax=Thelephora terrestris TaxID=56493 RepID=A0A9P6HAQ0_9AGAM|nr:hypothetical protein BJ322DRAFT_188059 [Thelephora terrestris]
MHSPVNQLPPEILREVFVHLRPVVIRKGSEQPQSTRSPLADLLAVTHTCQHWRRISIAAPQLWSHLIVRGSTKNSGDLTQLFIHRSGESDLSLDADLKHGLAAVVPYVNRLRALRCAGSSIQDFSELCNRPAPLLEILHILPHTDLASRGALPALFNDDFRSLRELYVNDFNPFPNNHFQGLSSLRLQLSPTGINVTFWNPFFETLRNSRRLEELFLSLGFCSNHFPSVQDIPTLVALRDLQRLHIRGFASNLASQFLNSVDLPPNRIAMQFTNIIPQFDWMRPPTLPLDLSFHAATSLEIIYFYPSGLTVQGTSHNMQIRLFEHADSTSMHTEIFLSFLRRGGPGALGPF